MLTLQGGWMSGAASRRRALGVMRACDVVERRRDMSCARALMTSTVTRARGTPTRVTSFNWLLCVQDFLSRLSRLDEKYLPLMNLMQRGTIGCKYLRRAALPSRKSNHGFTVSV